MTERTRTRELYNCRRCPGYCCSYPLIAVGRRDVERLARHHNLTFDEARTRFTKEAYGRKYVLRRKADKHFGKICRFFDTEARQCTIYTARPGICRTFPGEGRCGYYDFLAFERRTQDDPEWVSRTNHG